MPLSIKDHSRRRSSSRRTSARSYGKKRQSVAGRSRRTSAIAGSAHASEERTSSPWCQLVPLTNEPLPPPQALIVEALHPQWMAKSTTTSTAAAAIVAPFGFGKAYLASAFCQQWVQVSRRRVVLWLHAHNGDTLRASYTAALVNFSNGTLQQQQQQQPPLGKWTTHELAVALGEQLSLQAISEYTIVYHGVTTPDPNVFFEQQCVPLGKNLSVKILITTTHSSYIKHPMLPATLELSSWDALDTTSFLVSSNNYNDENAGKVQYNSNGLALELDALGHVALQRLMELLQGHPMALALVRGQLTEQTRSNENSSNNQQHHLLESMVTDMQQFRNDYSNNSSVDDPLAWFWAYIIAQAVSSSGETDCDKNITKENVDDGDLTALILTIAAYMDAQAIPTNLLIDITDARNEQRQAIVDQLCRLQILHPWVAPNRVEEEEPAMTNLSAPNYSARHSIAVQPSEDKTRRETGMNSSMSDIMDMSSSSIFDAVGGSMRDVSTYDRRNKLRDSSPQFYCIHPFLQQAIRGQQPQFKLAVLGQPTSWPNILVHAMHAFLASTFDPSLVRAVIPHVQRLQSFLQWQTSDDSFPVVLHVEVLLKTAMALQRAPLRDYTRAKEFFVHAAAMYDAASHSDDLGNDQRLGQKLYSRLANVSRLLEDDKDAILYSKRSLELYDYHVKRGGHKDLSQYGKHDTATVEKLLQTCAHASSAMGQLRDARAYFEEELSVKLLVNGQEGSRPDGNIARNLNNLGCVCRDLGDLEAARNYSLQGLFIQQTIQKEHPPEDEPSRENSKPLLEMANTLSNLGSLSFSLGAFEKAREYFEESLEIQQKVYDARAKRGEPLVDESQNQSLVTSIAESTHNLATILDRLGEHVKARHCYERSLEMKNELYGSNEANADKALTIYGMALLCMNNAEYKPAKDHFLNALSMQREFYGQDAKNMDIARTLHGLGSLSFYLCDMNRSKEYHREALEIQKEVRETTSHGNQFLSDPRNANLARILDNLGNISHNLGKYSEANDYYEQAMDLYYQLADDHPNLAGLVAELKNTKKSITAYEDAREYYKRSLQLKYQIYGEDENNIDLSNSLQNLGVLNDNCGCYEEAKECYAKCLSMQTAVYGGKNSQNSEIASTLLSLGITQCRLGEYGASGSTLKQSLVMTNTVHGGCPSSEAGITHMYLGSLAHTLSHYDDAQMHLERSLEIFQQVYGEDAENLDVATTFISLANLYRDLGPKYYEKAEQMLQKALSICSKEFGEGTENAFMAALLVDLGVFYRVAGDFDNANHYLILASTMQEKVYGNQGENLQKATVLLELGKLYREQGQSEKARELFQGSLEIRQSIHGGKLNHPDIAECHLCIGQTSAEEGKLQEGKRHIDKARCMLEEVFGSSGKETTTSRTLGETLLCLGQIAQQEGNTEEADRVIAQAQSIAANSTGGATISLAGLKLYSAQSTADDAATIDQQDDKFREGAELATRDDESVMGEAQGSLEKARVFIVEGKSHHREGRLVEAKERFLGALAIQKSVLGEQHPLLAETYQLIAQTCAEQGVLDEAKDYLKRSLSAMESSTNDGAASFKAVEALLCLSELAWSAGDAEEADRLLEQALTLLSKLRDSEPGKGHSGNIEKAQSLLEQGKIYREQHQSFQSQLCLQESLETLRSVYCEEDDAEIGGCYHSIVNACKDEASIQSDIAKAVSSNQNLEGPDEQTPGMDADLSMVMSSDKKAEDFDEQQITEDLQEPVMVGDDDAEDSERSETHPLVAQTYQFLARACAYQGKLEETKQYLELSLLAFKSSIDEEGSPHEVEVLLCLGELAWNAGAAEKANKLFIKASFILSKLPGSESEIDKARALLEQGNIYRKEGSLAQSHECFQKALNILRSTSNAADLGETYKSVRGVATSLASSDIQAGAMIIDEEARSESAEHQQLMSVEEAPPSHFSKMELGQGSTKGSEEAKTDPVEIQQTPLEASVDGSSQNDATEYKDAIEGADASEAQIGTSESGKDKRRPKPKQMGRSTRKIIHKVVDESPPIDWSNEKSVRKAFDKWQEVVHQRKAEREASVDLEEEGNPIEEEPSTEITQSEPSVPTGSVMPTTESDSSEKGRDLNEQVASSASNEKSLPTVDEAAPPEVLKAAKEASEKSSTEIALPEESVDMVEPEHASPSTSDQQTSKQGPAYLQRQPSKKEGKHAKTKNPATDSSEMTEVAKQQASGESTKEVPQSFSKRQVKNKDKTGTTRHVARSRDVEDFSKDEDIIDAATCGCWPFRRRKR